MDTIKTRKIKQDWLFPLVNTIFLILLMFITLYPVINTIAYSFNDGIDALRGNIGLLPRKFSLESYKSILSDKSVFLAAWISASKTVLITILNLFWTSMLAYALSRKEFVFRKLFTVIMVLTMYVNAGLIPNYLLISKTLNLRNNYLVYIIPTMFSCFNMIVIRTYISNLPDALIESARIDGAGDFRIFWQIIFPLCKPVLATVALFVAVGSWNSWFDTYLYNGQKKDLYSLQYILKMKLATTQPKRRRTRSRRSARPHRSRSAARSRSSPRSRSSSCTPSCRNTSSRASRSAASRNDPASGG